MMIFFRNRMTRKFLFLSTTNHTYRCCWLSFRLCSTFIHWRLWKASGNGYRCLFETFFSQEMDSKLKKNNNKNIVVCRCRFHPSTTYSANLVEKHFLHHLIKDQREENRSSLLVSCWARASSHSSFDFFSSCWRIYDIIESIWLSRLHFNKTHLTCSAF